MDLESLYDTFTTVESADVSPSTPVPVPTRESIENVFQQGFHKIKEINPKTIQRSTGVYGEHIDSKDAYSVEWMEEETDRLLKVASDPVYQFLNTLCGVIICEFNDVIDSEKALTVSSNILRQLNKFQQDGRMASVANEVKRNRPELEAIDRKTKRKKGDINNIMNDYSSSLRSNTFNYQPFFNQHTFDVSQLPNIKDPSQFKSEILRQTFGNESTYTYKNSTYSSANTNEMNSLFKTLQDTISKYIPGEIVNNPIERKFLHVVCSIDYDVLRNMDDAVRSWWTNDSKFDFVHNRNSKEENKKKTEEMLKKIIELGGKGPPSLGIALGVAEPLPISSVFAALRWLIEEKQSISAQDLQLIMTIFASEPPNSPEWTSMVHHLGNIFIHPAVKKSVQDVLISIRYLSNIHDLSANDFIGLLDIKKDPNYRTHTVREKFATYVGLKMLIRRNEVLIRMNSKWTYDVIVEKERLSIELFQYLKRDKDGTLYFDDRARNILSGIQNRPTISQAEIMDNNITKTYLKIMNSLKH